MWELIKLEDKFRNSKNEKAISQRYNTIITLDLPHLRPQALDSEFNKQITLGPRA